MKITINTFGSMGDVRPYVALGVGLKEAGHQVSLLTHDIFEELVRAQDLAFYGLAIDPKQVLVNQAVADFGGNTFKVIGWMREHFKVGLKMIFEETLAAVQGADLLLNSPLSLAGWHIAQKLKLPAIATNLWPSTPSRTCPSASAKIAPDWLPFKSAYTYASAKLYNQLFLQMLRPLTNDLRKELLGLTPLGARYYWHLDDPQSDVRMLYAYSPTVVPRPQDWGANLQVTGYWFLDKAKAYQSPVELVDFLESGPPPVSVGFGSMVDHERRAMTRLVVQALEQAGQRGLLLGGWSEIGGIEMPNTILQMDFVPHDWLFPRMAAVVHHGGAGTTAAGLRAGKPTIVVPFFGDQAFWGWRVQQLGAGPKPAPRQTLTAEKLAAAIQKAVTDPQIGHKAAQVGMQVQAENGIGQAVEWIERWTAQGGSWGF